MTAAVLAALSACGGGESADGRDASATTAEVTIRTFSFEPDPVTVAAGTTITFRNEDKIDHTVTAGTRDAPTPERFDETLDGQGTTAEVTLEEPGTYDYFCEIHPGDGMTGQIIVA